MCTAQFRKVIILVLCLVELLFATLAFAAQNPKAGRTFAIGDKIPDSISCSIEASLQSDNNLWKILVCLFTKPDQRFSLRLKSDLQLFIKRHELTDLRVIEISAAPDSKENEGHNWLVKFDPDSQLYRDMGLTVVPTLLLFNTEWIIIGYIAGYSPGFTNTLRQQLSAYYPKLSEKPQTIIPENQLRYHRTENMAKTLFTRREYQLARSVLEHTDSLSHPGKVLLGMLYFEAGAFQSAHNLFSTLIQEEIVRNYAQYGLGIIALAEKHPELALEYLNQVVTISEQNKLDYARHLAKKQLDNHISETESNLSLEIDREALLVIP